MPTRALDAASGATVVVDDGQSLLGAIEGHGFSEVSIGCRNGGCGVCRVHLLEGRVRLGKMSRRFVTLEMERERYALACRVYPESDITFRSAPLERLST